MEKSLSRLVVWGVIGFLAQFVDGTLGMGYGVFSNTLVVAAGVVPALASASVHNAEVVTTLVSGGSHLFFGNVKREWLLALIIPGIIGGVLGALLLASVPGKQIKPVIASFLLLLGALIIYRFARRKKTSAEAEAAPIGSSEGRGSPSLKIPLLGLVAAFVDAIGGGGWGPIATPGLILGENAEPRKVVGTVNLAEFFITIAISGTFIIKMGWDAFDWGLVGALALGGIIAAPVAAFCCRRLPVKLLGILIGLLIIAYNLRTLLTALL
ncbi:MAG: sulfite exporter TauE/SafE family protein [Chloroflexota bacterium]